MTDELRRQLVHALRGTQAHMAFEEAVDAIPEAAVNLRAPNVPYTFWHLVEHLRLTQRDILEYVQDSVGYRARRWPDDYWPSGDAETTPDGFKASVQGYLTDRKALEAIVLDPDTDLTAVLPKTPGHTIVREILVVANHDSYHVGELAILRQVTDTWGPDHR